MEPISPTCVPNRVAADPAPVQTAVVEEDAAMAVAAEGEAIAVERGRVRATGVGDHTRVRVKSLSIVRMIKICLYYILPVPICKSMEFIVHHLFGVMGLASCRHRGARLGEHRPHWIRLTILLKTAQCQVLHLSRRRCLLCCRRVPSRRLHRKL